MNELNLLPALADEIRSELAKLGRKYIHVYCDKQADRVFQPRHRGQLGQYPRPKLTKYQKSVYVRVTHKQHCVAQISYKEGIFSVYCEYAPDKTIPEVNWRDFAVSDPNSVDQIIDLLMVLFG